MSISTFDQKDGDMISRTICFESSLYSLPNELIIKISQYLLGRDMLNLIQTNKRFNIIDDRTINDAKVIAKMGDNIEEASFKFYKISCDCVFLTVPKNISSLSHNIQKILYDKAIKLSIKNCTYYAINNMTSIKNPLDDDDIVYYIICMTKATKYQKELIRSIDYSHYNVGNIIFKLSQKGYDDDNIIDCIYNNFIDNGLVIGSDILSGSYLRRFIETNPEFWVIIMDHIINKKPEAFHCIYMSKEEHAYIIDNLQKQLFKRHNDKILQRFYDIFYIAPLIGDCYFAYLT